MPSDWLELAKKYAAKAADTPRTSPPASPASIRSPIPAAESIEVKSLPPVRIPPATTKSGHVEASRRLHLPGGETTQARDETQNGPNGAAAISASMHDRSAAQTALEVLESLREVIGPAPTQRGGAQRLCERLALDKVLLSRVLAALRCANPLDGLARLPGPLPLRRLVASALRAQLIDDTLHARSLRAIDSFAIMIRSSAKDRSGLEAALRTPSGALSFELTRKQAAFRAISQLWGYQARCMYVFAVADAGPAIVSIQDVHILRREIAPIVVADLRDGGTLLEPFCHAVSHADGFCTLAGELATCTRQLANSWPLEIPVETPAMAAVIEVMLPPGKPRSLRVRTFAKPHPRIERELDINERCTVRGLHQPQHLSTKDSLLLAATRFRIGPPSANPAPSVDPSTSTANTRSLLTIYAPHTQGWDSVLCIIRYPLVGSTIVIE